MSVKSNSPETIKTSVFQCSMCGECCTSVTLPIEAHKADALLEKPWVRARLKEFNHELIRIDCDYYRLPLRDNQYCVFLNPDDNKCLIEVHEGPDLKPEECKRFPFARIETPDGNSSYDCSAACKTVAEELLPRFAPIVPATGREPAAQELTLPSKIKTHGNRTIEVQTYERYARSLWALFANPAVDAVGALCQAQALLLALPEAPDVSGVSGRFSPAWERWLPLLLARKPYGMMSVFELLRGGHYNDPRLFGEPVSLPETANWPAFQPSGQNPPENPKESLLKGFLVNILNRRVLLTYGHSLSSLLSMACAAWVLVRWYARVLAVVAGKTQAGREEAAMAIRLVERYYTGHQPRFPERFRPGKGLSGLHKRALKTAKKG